MSIVAIALNSGLSRNGVFFLFRMLAGLAGLAGFDPDGL